jgi:hypothetical protein
MSADGCEEGDKVETDMNTYPRRKEEKYKYQRRVKGRVTEKKRGNK